MNMAKKVKVDENCKCMICGQSAVVPLLTFNRNTKDLNWVKHPKYGECHNENCGKEE
tara:strand:+ start:4936 stop:5106 length:171 start_codon:yes stop_codon:yes gene_type:complete